MIKCRVIYGRILFCLVRCGRTRHGADRNPVLQGDLAGTVVLEMGGAAREDAVIGDQSVNQVFAGCSFLPVTLPCGTMLPITRILFSSQNRIFWIANSEVLLTGITSLSGALFAYGHYIEGKGWWNIFLQGGSGK